MSFDHDAFFSGEGYRETLVERRAAYEDAVVRHLLNRYGLGALIRRYLNELRTRTGRKSQFTLAWFYDTFPDFPALLGVAKLWGTSDIDVGTLFADSGFTKTPIFKAFTEMGEDLAPDGEPFGMVFEYRRVGKFVMLHTLPREFNNLRGGAFIRGIGKEPVTLYVMEKLQDYLDTIHWQPPVED